MEPITPFRVSVLKAGMAVLLQVFFRQSVLELIYPLFAYLYPDTLSFCFVSVWVTPAACDGGILQTKSPLHGTVNPASANAWSI